MARDANGNYSLPAGNPVVVDDLIEANWANTTLDDLATAMQDSLSRSGQGGMTAGLKAFAGTINLPGYSWSDETASGWYRASAGNFRFSISAIDILTLTSSLFTVPALTSVAAITGGTVLNLAAGANIASAATINLTTATGQISHITGTTQIDAVTLGAGMFRQVVFDGALTLTHHATNNNLPGAANITTAAGDRALYWSDGTAVYCVGYTKANGRPVVDSPTFPSGTVMLFVQTAAPTGWTKLTARNNYAIRVVSGAASQNDGGVGFTTAFASQAVSGTVGGTSITQAQLPTNAIVALGASPDQGATGSTGRGSGDTHTHSFTGTAINLAVNYIDVIQAQKD